MLLDKNGMNMNDHIKIEYHERTAIVTYNRGAKKNALSMQAIKDLTSVADVLRDRHELVSVVLAGSPEAFTSGVDLKDPARFDLSDKSLAERRHILSLGTRMCKAWEELPQLTIAAIEGLNVGGGVALTLCCDWRVMAENAYLYVPEIQIGITLSWHTVPRLVNMVGAAKAKQIMLLGAKMTSAEAKELGLADWITPAGETTSYARAMADRVSQFPSHVVKMSKQSVNAHANALNYLSTYMDVDQALVCAQSSEATAARRQFQ